MAAVGIVSTLWVVSTMLKFTSGTKVDRNYEWSPFPAPRQSDLWSVVLGHDGAASLMPGQVRGAAAWGSYNDAINETGWGLLDVHSSPSLGGHNQSYAAGFLEGALTHMRIAHSLHNTWEIDFEGHVVGSVPEDVRRFVTANDAWMREQIDTNRGDSYWRTMDFLLSQRRGLSDGYNAARDAHEPQMDEFGIYMLSLINADMDDLVAALKYKANASKGQPRRPLTLRDVRQTGHCSVLIQPAPGNADLWVSHVTWDVYRNMLRMVKYMDLPLPGVTAQRLAFSSFPGSLYSSDGFHVTSEGLTTVETTLANNNASAWMLVRPEGVFTWARAMLANRLASDGDAWTEVQTRHNSGTCNNQWMVVDYKRFFPGEEALRNGTVWIAETMPGRFHRGDVTEVISQQGSWPSYNIPYFKDMWQAGGYGMMQERQPEMADDFSFTKAPRALMFERARRNNTVTSLQSFMRLMRYNHADVDPLARSDTCNGISARCDLNPHSSHNYNCFGAQDAKVTSLQGAKRDLSFLGILSPTYDDQTPFSWSKQDPVAANCKPEQHVGHPDTFDFGWHSFPDVIRTSAETSGTEPSDASAVVV